MPQATWRIPKPDRAADMLVRNWMGIPLALSYLGIAWSRVKAGLGFQL